MAIEFNPNKTNNPTSSAVNKKRSDGQTVGHTSTSTSEDKVSVNSLASAARVDFEPVKSSAQAKDLASQINEQLRSNPELARSAYGNSNAQATLNLLGESA